MFLRLNIFSILGLAFLCNACTSVDYVNNAGYSELTGEKINREADFDTSRGAKQYGALIFKKDPRKAASEEGNSFVVALKRQKSKFFGEATLFESKNSEKTFIDQTIFRFGADKKDKGLALGMSFRF